MMRLAADLERRVRETIRRYRMFDPEDSILVAVSGGPDSVALLHILLALPTLQNCGIGVAHFNHLLRNDASDADAAFVKQLCESLDLPCFLGAFDCRNQPFGPGVSLEDAARKARYRFLLETAQTHHYTKIALGHQADDNAEQVLLALFRGSGLKGVCGIPPVRNGIIVRPLIRTRKEVLLDFLRANALDWRIDASNSDTVFLRNALRHEIMPQLQAHFSNAVPDILNRFARIASDEDEWVETLITPMAQEIIEPCGPDVIRMRCGPLRSLHRAAQRRIVVRALALLKNNRLHLSFFHVEAILGLLDRSGNRRLHLPDGVMVQKAEEEIRLHRVSNRSGRQDRPDPAVGYAYLLARPEMNRPTRLRIAEADAEILAEILPAGDACDRGDACQAYFDPEGLRFPLTVRSPSPGDRFRPMGMAGSKKLSRFFIDRKIPHELRSLWPIVVSEGDILWVCGLRRGNAHPVRRWDGVVLRLAVYGIGRKPWSFSRQNTGCGNSCLPIGEK
jgi:tRNA(Ile)-lysidine synthase